MKAVVFHDIGDIRLEDVAEPRRREPTDAIVRLTASAICGTDLHFVRGSVGGMRPGTILGHEGVGIVEALGDEVRNLQVGDRVVIPRPSPAAIACIAEPATTPSATSPTPAAARPAPRSSAVPANGGFHGLQAEKARIPYANIGLIRLPSSISDDQAIPCRTSSPPVTSAPNWPVSPPATPSPCSAAVRWASSPSPARCSRRRQGVRHRPPPGPPAHGLRQQGAEVIDFEREDPVQALRWLTAGIGVDRAIDAVGVDAEHSHGTATPAPRQEGTSWSPATPRTGPGVGGAGPGQGRHPVDHRRLREDSRQFPIGLAMNRNLTIRMGNCHHRKYIPLLLEHVLSGRIDPAKILTQVKPIGDAIEAFEAFDRRETGWIKVELVPQKRQVEGSEERLDERAVDELARRPTPESGARGDA